MWNILTTYTKGKTSKNIFPKYFTVNTNDTLENHADIAEHFNTFFSSIGKDLQRNIRESTESPLTHLDRNDNTIDSLEPTNSDEVIEILKTMKNVGAGIDNINAKIFKLTYLPIIQKLVHFINVCLMKGTFPSQLKIAVIKPIYKSGDKTKMTNYRPISILPYISKIIEKVMHARMMDHISEHDVLCSTQFGFRKGYSTYMPLLLLQDLVTKTFEQNKIACGVFLALKKAFDTVEHDILLLKLQSYGFNYTFLSLIKSYLHNRCQCVDYMHVKSELRQINIGVPQGSILGPLLFLLYINDLHKVCNMAKTLLYADDTALIFEADSAAELQTLLDAELPKISKWFQVNKLSLNADKTYFQLYNNSRINSDITVFLNGTKIKHAERVKYLGMFVDENMKWKSHIEHISTIISRNIGIISRSRFFLRHKHLLLLYNALVLPYLSYCALIWGFSPRSHLHKISVLQKKAVRIIEGQPRLAHSDPLFSKLNLLKIEDIAKQQAIVIMHNVVNQRTSNEICSLFDLAPHNERNSRNIKHFTEMFASKLYRTRTLAWLGPRLWNTIITPFYPDLQTVPISKQSIKKLTKNKLTERYA